MCAMKSQCKALVHIRTALWPRCGWKCLFCFIKLSEDGAHRVDSSAQSGSTGPIAPPGKVRISYVKLRILVFEDSVCNEIAIQGIGAHKNGPLAAMWLEMLVLLH